MRKLLGCAAAVLMMAVLSACGGQGTKSPVFGAVFGISGAEVTPHVVGRIPEPVAHPGDRLVGKAANNPGLCIWENRVGQRFRADCA